MIDITKEAKVVMLTGAQHRDPAWWTMAKKIGCKHGSLILETIVIDGQPVCPMCLVAADDYEIRSGAGLFKCRACHTLFVALRFVGGKKGEEWHCFPWPK